MGELQIGGHTYSVGRLNAIDANHVVRVLSPALVMLNGTKVVDGFDPAETMARALCLHSRMVEQEDLDRAYAKCLSVVRRKLPNGAGWGVMVTSGDRLALMFEGDTDLMTLLRLVWAVLEENRLIDFFAVAPSASAQGGQTGSPS